jgi:hypothetical protein
MIVIFVCRLFKFKKDPEKFGQVGQYAHVIPPFIYVD